MWPPIVYLLLRARLFRRPLIRSRRATVKRSSRFTPGVDNGSSITNYEYSLDGVNYTALDSADVTSPITITGLTNGAEYSITLRALNGNGEGAVSGSVSVTPAGLPTAPQITNTDYGNEEIYLTLAWPTTAAQPSLATLPPAPMAPRSTQALAAPLALQFQG